MSKKFDRFLGKNLTEKIHEYNATYKKFHETERNRVIYREIYNEVMYALYTLPVKYFRMDREDAGEFLLSVEPDIGSLVSNFGSYNDNFEEYLKVCLKGKIRGFYSSKRRKELKENVVANYEYALLYDEQYWNQSEEFNMVLQEAPPAGESEGLQKLKFIFYRSKTARKRFAIYFLSESPFLPAVTIDKICYSFNFSRSEVQRVMNTFASAAVPIFNQLNGVTELRNYNWQRILCLDNLYCNMAYYGSYEAQADIYRRISLNKKRQMERNTFIATFAPKLGPSQIMHYTNMARGTISSGFFYAKNFLSWCYYPNEYNAGLSTLGLPDDILEDFKTGRWKLLLQRYEKAGRLPLFHPVKELGLAHLMN